uniref:Uncharacterized protein n=1 Tax=Rhabditophanes sp. KR3021 TaxID=114890 RepID=A0AC35TWH7_9BILA
MIFHQSSNDDSGSFQEFIQNVNPIFFIIIGGFILAGCVFELVHTTRTPSTPRANWAHVTSRQEQQFSSANSPTKA